VSADWKTVTLGDVAEFVRGINFKPDDVVPTGTPGAVACMRTKNVQAALDLSDVWSVGEQFVRREDQFLRAGDVLVSSANSWNLVGKCCWVPELPGRSSFGGFVSVLRPQCARVEPRFLFRWFSSTRIQTTVRSFGQQTTNISNLNIDRCLKLPLPLPPLAEQRRIAEVLDRTEALRAKRRAALAQLDSLTQSLFLDLFGNPVVNPKKWKACTVGEITDCIVPGRDKPKSFTGNIPWITTDDLHHLELTFESPKGLGLNAAEIAEVRARIIPKESVIISCVGDLGIVSIAGKDLVINQQLHAFQCPANLNNVFLMHCLAFQEAFMYAKASSTTLPYMNKTVCNSIPVIVPPLELQREFVRRVTAAETLKRAQRESLGELDALFAALQHRAFRGEI
jgi:type I restriction enzyme S subunit